MNIKCAKVDFLAKLQLALKVVSVKSVMPVLAGIKIKTVENQLEILATDLNLSMRLFVDAEIVEPGEIVAPARLLMDIVRSLPGRDFVMDYSDETKNVSIFAGDAQFHITTLPAEDFPAIQQLEEDEAFEIDAVIFSDTVSILSKVASRNENVPVLTGILLKIEEQKVTMVAIDSSRFAVKEGTISNTASEKLSVVIPRNALEELIRIQANLDIKKFKVQILDNLVVFQCNSSIYISARLLQGRYPEYQHLIPTEFKYTVELDKEAALMMVQRVGVLAQKGQAIKLTFSQDILDIYASTPTVGEADEKMSLFYPVSDDIAIGFNDELLADGIDSIRSTKVTLSLNEPTKPIVITGEEKGYLYLLAPVVLK